MKLFDENAAAPLVFAADLALAQGRNWFLFRGNRIKFVKDDLIPAPEPFNLAAIYVFTTKKKERMFVSHSFLSNRLIVKTET